MIVKTHLVSGNVKRKQGNNGWVGGKGNEDTWGQQEMEKSDGVSDLYMRDYEADVPLITYLRVIKGQDTSVTSVTPTLRQRHTDTDRGRQREANTGGGRWKGCQHAFRTEPKRWVHRYTVEDKIYFKDKMSRWTDAEQRDKAKKQAMRGGITRMKESTENNRADKSSGKRKCHRAGSGDPVFVQLLFSVLLCHVSSAGFVLYSLCSFVSVCCSCLGSLSLCLPWVPRLATFVSVLYISTSQFLVCVFVNVMLPVLFW